MTTEERIYFNVPLLDYLLSLGVEDVHHTNGKFLPHLQGLAAYLERYNRPFTTIVAGLFHSIYGTETFNGFSISLERRTEVKKNIGVEAEALVYTYCRMSGASFSRSVRDNKADLLDRELITSLHVTPEQFIELQWMMLLDTLEVDSRIPDAQLGRLWLVVAANLGKDAKVAIEEVYNVKI